jgi:hypothetical protein
MLKFTDIDFITKQTTTRDLTKAELDFLENKKIEALQIKAEAEAKATAKAELLERLGITADEAKLLLA